MVRELVEGVSAMDGCCRLARVTCKKAAGEDNMAAVDVVVAAGHKQDLHNTDIAVVEAENMPELERIHSVAEAGSWAYMAAAEGNTAVEQDVSEAGKHTEAC